MTYEFSIVEKSDGRKHFTTDYATWDGAYNAVKNLIAKCYPNYLQEGWLISCDSSDAPKVVRHNIRFGNEKVYARITERKDDND